MKEFIQPNRPNQATEIDYNMADSIKGQPPRMQNRKEKINVIFDGNRTEMEIMQRVSRT